MDKGESFGAPPFDIIIQKNIITGSELLIKSITRTEKVSVLQFVFSKGVFYN